jgi:hypothetical protein
MERLTAEQLKVIDLSLIEWYYEQATARHNDLVCVESLITERGYNTLFATYFAILTASVGYILTHLNVNDDVALTAGCLSIIVFISIAIGYIYQVIRPHSFFSPGKDPDKFTIPQYIAYFKGKDTDQKKQVVSDELIVLQQKISAQDAMNEKRVGYTKRSLAFLIFGSFVAVIFFLIAFAIY